MKEVDRFFTQANKIIPYNKTSIIVFIVFILLVLWGGIRSCSQPPAFDKTKTFIIARDPRWYPLNLMGKETNVLAFTNDLFLTIANERGVRLQLISVAGNSLFEGLRFKQYDGIISSLLPNPINNQIYNFSDTIFYVGPVLIVPVNSTISSFDQMDNKVVGIPKFHNVSIDISKYRSFYKPFNSITDAVNDLDFGQVDGILLPIMQAYTFIEGFRKGDFKVVTQPLSNQGLRLVTLQNEQSQYVIHEFNIGLKNLIENGTYNALCTKWGLIDPFTHQDQ